MSIIHSKLLELVSIKEESGTYFLHTKLSYDLEKDVLIVWEIDSNTAQGLEAVIEFCSHYKYRLSYLFKSDSLKGKYTGMLTRTFRDQSEQVYFSCSEDFIHALQAIKNTDDINSIYALSFISTDQPRIDEQTQNKIQDIKMDTGHRPKTMWVAVALISIVFSTLLGYSSHASQNNAPIYEKRIAYSVMLDNETDVEKKEAIFIEDQPEEQLAFPVIQLQSPKTFSLQEGTVALTFDDGPSQYTAEIIDVLKEYEVGATFFFTGVNVKKYPEYVAYAYANGNTIGNHSMTHSNFLTISLEQQKYELIQASQLIEEIIGEKVALFRPPYGAINEPLETLLLEHEMKTVLWNNDPKDWDSRDAEKILHSIYNSTLSGDIILLHESQAVINALPRIIEYTREQGLEFVVLQ